MGLSINSAAYFSPTILADIKTMRCVLDFPVSVTWESNFFVVGRGLENGGIGRFWVTREDYTYLVDLSHCYLILNNIGDVTDQMKFKVKVLGSVEKEEYVYGTDDAVEIVVCSYNSFKNIPEFIPKIAGEKDVPSYYKWGVNLDRRNIDDEEAPEEEEPVSWGGVLQQVIDNTDIVGITYWDGEGMEFKLHDTIDNFVGFCPSNLTVFDVDKIASALSMVAVWDRDTAAIRLFRYGERAEWSSYTDFSVGGEFLHRAVSSYPAILKFRLPRAFLALGADEEMVELIAGMEFTVSSVPSVVGTPEGREREIEISEYVAEGFYDSTGDLQTNATYINAVVDYLANSYVLRLQSLIGTKVYVGLLDIEPDGQVSTVKFSFGREGPRTTVMFSNDSYYKPYRELAESFCSYPNNKTLDISATLGMKRNFGMMSASGGINIFSAVGADRGIIIGDNEIVVGMGYTSAAVTYLNLVEEEVIVVPQYSLYYRYFSVLIVADPITHSIEFRLTPVSVDNWYHPRYEEYRLETPAVRLNMLDPEHESYIPPSYRYEPKYGLVAETAICPSEAELESYCEDLE